MLLVYLALLPYSAFILYLLCEEKRDRVRCRNKNKIKTRVRGMRCGGDYDVIWNEALCYFIKIYRSFVGTFCLHLQGTWQTIIHTT